MGGGVVVVRMSEVGVLGYASSVVARYSAATVIFRVVVGLCQCSVWAGVSLFAVRSFHVVERRSVG